MMPTRDSFYTMKNLESNDSDYESLITKIMSNPKGKTFINPQPSII